MIAAAATGLFMGPTPCGGTVDGLTIRHHPPFNQERRGSSAPWFAVAPDGRAFASWRLTASISVRSQIWRHGSFQERRKRAAPGSGSERSRRRSSLLTVSGSAIFCRRCTEEDRHRRRDARDDRLPLSRPALSGQASFWRQLVGRQHGLSLNAPDVMRVSANGGTPGVRHRDKANKSGGRSCCPVVMACCSAWSCPARAPSMTEDVVVQSLSSEARSSSGAAVTRSMFPTNCT